MMDVDEDARYAHEDADVRPMPAVSLCFRPGTSEQLGWDDPGDAFSAMLDRCCDKCTGHHVVIITRSDGYRTVIAIPMRRRLYADWGDRYTLDRSTAMRAASTRAQGDPDDE